MKILYNDFSALPDGNRAGGNGRQVQRRMKKKERRARRRALIARVGSRVRWSNTYRKAVKHTARLAVALPLLTAIPIETQATALPQSRTRAMWVWETSNIISDPNAALKLFVFCATPPGSADRINTLYFAAHSAVNGDAATQASLHNFLRSAHAHGIRVEYLDGAADWATTGKTYAEQQLGRMLQFNRATNDANQRFDGVQYDVEPYLLAGWFSDATWSSYMSLVNDCEQAVHATGGGIPFGVCIPRWYDVTPGPQYLTQVQKATDYVAVMDYVNTTSSLIADAKSEVANAAALGKKVVLGVETMNISPSTVSFHDLGWSQMNMSLAQLATAYSSSAGFLGTAVHHYDTYVSLTKDGTYPIAMLSTQATTK